MERYVNAVCQHICEYGALSTGYRVDSVYFGGGTPSLLGGKRLVRILAEIQKRFSMANNPEITVECNPDSMSRKLLRQLRRAGVNRLSVGVQSVLDDELVQLGRVHTWEQARDMLLLAKKLKFTNIGVDLIYGQPNQTVEMLMQSLEAVLELEPMHLSCYALQLEPETPMGQMQPILPDEDIQADMYDALCTRLRKAGFEHYEISNWSREGNRSKHNSKYWDLSDYLGLGPAAHSYMQERRFSFVQDLDAYCAEIEAKNGAIVEEAEDVPTMKRHGEYLMLRLRTSDGVDENQFQQLFDRSFVPYADKLQPYIEQGFAAYQAGRWYLTEIGMLVSNTIIAEVLSADVVTEDAASEEPAPEMI